MSLWVQVDGLIGARGILPVGQFLDWVRGQTGSERYWLLPTLCWISSSDAFLHLLCGAGLAALLLVLGWRAAAALCWVLYLSLAIAGQVFLQFHGTTCCSRSDCSRSSSAAVALAIRPRRAAAPVVLFLCAGSSSA